MPEVSIITPLYNSEKTISETIESVINQTFTDWELILIDDCSSDDTMKIAREWQAKDNRILVIERKWNAGPAVTRNRGIQEARGRYIAFLDADDLWCPQKLTVQIGFMNKYDCAISYTAYQKINYSGHRLGIIKIPNRVGYKDLLKSNSIGCSTAIYDSSKIGKVYMPNISKRQDLGLWLKITKKNISASGINDILMLYRVGGESTVSSNKLLAMKYQWRLYREIERISLFGTIFYFSFYLVQGFLKYRK